MYPLDQQAFEPLVNSTAPAFNSSAFGSTSQNYALQSTGAREWQLPGSRNVRLLASSGVFYAKLGDSTVSAASSDSMLVIGGTPTILSVSPKVTHIAFVSSTTVTVNVTLGIGR